MSVQLVHSIHDSDPIAIPAIGLNLSVRIPSSTTGGALTVIETLNSPGFGPPLHRHPEAEIFRVLEGRYLYEVDGKRFYGEEGDCVSIPEDAAHTFVNVGNSAASTDNDRARLGCPHIFYSTRGDHESRCS